LKEEEEKIRQSMRQEAIGSRQNFAIIDDIDVAEYREIVPLPAITYNFELDDF
jgi:hypothetical protein